MPFETVDAPRVLTDKGTAGVPLASGLLLGVVLDPVRRKGLDIRVRKPYERHKSQDNVETWRHTRQKWAAEPSSVSHLQRWREKRMPTGTTLRSAVGAKDDLVTCTGTALLSTAVYASQNRRSCGSLAGIDPFYVLRLKRIILRRITFVFSARAVWVRPLVMFMAVASAVPPSCRAGCRGTHVPRLPFVVNLLFHIIRMYNAVQHHAATVPLNNNAMNAHHRYVPVLKRIFPYPKRQSRNSSRSLVSDHGFTSHLWSATSHPLQSIAMIWPLSLDEAAWA